MDARELAAVNRASDRSWNEFPYWEMRFGERGRRFSLSDGAWNVTLCSGTVANALEKCAGSARCFPRAACRRFCSSGISSSFTKSSARSVTHICSKDRASSRDCAARKSGNRHSIGSPTNLMKERPGVAPIPGMGVLLVSAVCDEALGIEHAVDNIVNWTETRGQEKGRWINAIRSTIASARAALRR